VSPHLRKHGGPTTIINAANAMHKRGHDVSISCVYADINPQITVMSKVPISLDINKIPACDVMVVNSDNPDSNYFVNLEHAKHKILYKMSHNARFKELEEASLQEKWDRVITSSQWLMNACKTPMEGWNHPPVDNVQRVGWTHYGHKHFACHPSGRTYGSKDSSFIITTLVHAHPLKGTNYVIQVLDRLRRKYNIEAIGVGEVPPNKVNLPPWMRIGADGKDRYQFSVDRDRMAKVFQQTDIWVGASQTEGLGRLALENMSAGVACVLSDTGAEFAVHEENCLIYPIGDLTAMEECIERLIEDRELFEKIIYNAYETARYHGGSDEFIMNLERVIYEVCKDDC
jgi:glycosyltransferase involved in cell wall biosynthesis